MSGRRPPCCVTRGWRAGGRFRTVPMRVAERRAAVGALGPLIAAVHAAASRGGASSRVAALPVPAGGPVRSGGMPIRPGPRPANPSAG